MGNKKLNRSASGYTIVSIIAYLLDFYLMIVDKWLIMILTKPVTNQLLSSIGKLDQFTSFEEESDSGKQHLIAACRVLAQLGFVFGVRGNFIVRNPKHLDCFWITPFGKHFTQLVGWVKTVWLF
ncbi:MAG: hypothetical protein F6K26_20955 [Moorea sp. SIO2I5]|nr:hypothetical protein [Moorena sp. SIO2I5]